MAIDIGTILLVLILSNAAQGIFILFQAVFNRKYDGIREHAAGSVLLAIGFLFLLLKYLNYFTALSTILGYALIMLASVYQYIGLMRFLCIKVSTRLLTLFYVFGCLVITYFTFVESVSIRIAALSFFISVIFTAIGISLSFNKIAYLKNSTKFLAFVYISVGILALMNGLNSAAAEFEGEIIESSAAQRAAYYMFFAVSLITTLSFTAIINHRLRANIAESKERFEQIFNLSPDAVIISVFSDGKIVNFNQGFLALFGFDIQDVSGKYIQDLEIYKDFNERNEILKDVNNKDLIKDVETSFLRKDGTEIICNVSYEKLILNNVQHLISIAHDITERKETEKNLKTNVEKYRFLTEFASDVTWVYNLTNRKYTYVSPSVFEIRGYTADEVLRETLEESFTPETLPILMDSISKNLGEIIQNPNSNEDYISEVQQPCKNGDIVWIEVSTKYFLNDEGEVEIIGVSRNIERRKKFEKQVMYLSYHDQLTGLYNRRYYEEELKRINVQGNLPISLIIADVNGLKLINDAFGHIAGDILLEKVANVFKAVCTGEEIVSRIGGDEFVFLLLKTGKDDAVKFVSELNKALADEKIYDVILSVSFGLSVKRSLAEDISLVYARAEDDMYRNKLSEKTEIRNKTIAIILNSLYKKNNYEKIHSKSVGALCEKIALALGLSSDEVFEVKTAGLMHDIGKIGISDFIINKNQKLSDSEYVEIKRHTETGYRILSSSNEFVKIAEYVLEHHEKWDGSGYPRGLAGKEISLPARIIAIADAYDVMKSERAYCNNRSDPEAISEIKKCAGTQFDPHIADVFIEKVLGYTYVDKN